MNKWLILDCSYLCHRAMHTTGQLTFGDVKTGIIFGFLRDIGTLCSYHDTQRIAFCFDSTKSKRRELYEPYKQARREKYEQMDEEEAKIWTEFRAQVQKLRREYLPAIGFNNIFVQRGHEADDIIGSLCLETLPQDGSEGVIIASDHDLFQLLGPLVTMWNPNKKQFYTAADFRREWGIGPERWHEVKAFAGCSGDGVEGIPGVGEKTAARWLKGEVNPKHKVHDKILGGMKTYTRNVPLVRLPFEGTKVFELVDDDVTKDKWNAVCQELGMTSLEGVDLGPDVRRRGVKPKNKRKGFGLT